MVYQIIRRIHLYTAFFLLSFVLMYFVTGYVMIHEGLLENREPQKKTRNLALKYKGEKTPEAYAAHLEQTYGFTGKRQPPQHREDGSWHFAYTRPGAAYEALISAAGDSVRITETQEHLRRTLVGFHRLHGYGGGLLYDIWAVCYDLASLSLILFTLSGIYLWYKLTRYHLLGWLLLVLSFALAASTIGYLLTLP
ncbi:MAG: PepSY-associated TM helix domain-containing protein [Candidatus Latescibacteria bacterium]|nr:PepSY-associated TM helix domain-containing protein [Candidatus Latescibacterota bacterium]